MGAAYHGFHLEEIGAKRHMDNYQRAAGWIDRFASRLQMHNVDREDAIEIAAQVWDEEGLTTCPERAAEAVCATWGRARAGRAGIAAVL